MQQSLDDQLTNLSHASQHAELGTRSVARRSRQGCFGLASETRARVDPPPTNCAVPNASLAVLSATQVLLLSEVRLWSRVSDSERLASATRSVETQLRDVNMSAGRNGCRTTLSCARTRCLSMVMMVSWGIVRYLPL